MNRPTAEQFAAAPLFRPYRTEAMAPYIDYSAETQSIEGFMLVRKNKDDGGFSFELEGLEILNVEAKEEFGAPVLVGTFFDKGEYRVYDNDVSKAAAEFAKQVHELVGKRGDPIVFLMEGHGVIIGREAQPGWVAEQEAVGTDAVPTDEDDIEDEDEDQFEGINHPVPGIELTKEQLIEMRFGPAVRIVREGFKCWIEGHDAERPWGEVRDEFARAGEDGTPLCPASLSILHQVKALEGNTEVAAHRADLKLLRQLVGDAGEIADQNLRAGVHMFDIVDSDLKDPVVPQAVIEAYDQAQIAAWTGDPEADQAGAVVLVDPLDRPAPRVADRPIGEIIRECTGYDVGEAVELRSMPTYRQEQIRATTRSLFMDLFGEDFPMEKVVVLRPASDPEAYAAFMYYFNDGELVNDVGPITFQNMPGYKTNHAHVRRRDGWDSLVFSDSFGTYAYSVPSPNPAAVLDADGPEDKDDPAPRM